MSDTNSLQRMCDVIRSSEEWLLQHVMSAAARSGLDRTPRSEQAWRDSIRGISDAIYQAAYAVTEGYGAGLADRDPVVAYGILRARSHRGLGVRPGDWIALLRHYRDAYLDLVAHAGFEQEDAAVCCSFIGRVFDRFESGFQTGYLAQQEGPHGPGGLSTAKV